MIFGYTLGQVRKMVIALVGTVLLLGGYFIVFEPGTRDAVIAIVIYGFGVVRVFLAKDVTVDEQQKAVEQLATSVIGLVGLYVTIQPSVLELVLAVVANVFLVLAVAGTRNDPLPTAPARR